MTELFCSVQCVWEVGDIHKLRLSVLAGPNTVMVLSFTDTSLRCSVIILQFHLEQRLARSIPSVLVARENLGRSLNKCPVCTLFSRSKLWTQPTLCQPLSNHFVLQPDMNKMMYWFGEKHSSGGPIVQCCTPGVRRRRFEAVSAGCYNTEASPSTAGNLLHYWIVADKTVKE